MFENYLSQQNQAKLFFLTMWVKFCFSNGRKTDRQRDRQTERHRERETEEQEERNKRFLFRRHSFVYQTLAHGGLL